MDYLTFYLLLMKESHKMGVISDDIYKGFLRDNLRASSIPYRVGKRWNDLAETGVGNYIKED